MQKFVIQGGRRLEGDITVQGAKNSALPILAAALLCGGESTLTNVPKLSDVYAACRILSSLGCTCRMQGHTVTVRADSLGRHVIPEPLMQEMSLRSPAVSSSRASLLVLTLTFSSA